MGTCPDTGQLWGPAQVFYQPSLRISQESPCPATGAGAPKPTPGQALHSQAPCSVESRPCLLQASRSQKRDVGCMVCTVLKVMSQGVPP
jgi:hypothetical protein